MKRITTILLILTLMLGNAFADTKITNVHFDAIANETTELVGNYFLEEPERLLVMAVNPDSIPDGFVIDYEDKSEIITFIPPDMFYGTVQFEYYFLDKDLRSYNVFATVSVDALEVDVVNQKIKKSCERLILSDIQEEYKEVYKQIIESIMMIEP